jgi:hypothetical protein
LQLYTSYEGAVMARTAATEPARAFLEFMTSDTARKAWTVAGFETVPAQ